MTPDQPITFAVTALGCVLSLILPRKWALLPLAASLGLFVAGLLGDWPENITQVTGYPPAVGVDEALLPAQRILPVRGRGMLRLVRTGAQKCEQAHQVDLRGGPGLAEDGTKLRANCEDGSATNLGDPCGVAVRHQ